MQTANMLNKVNSIIFFWFTQVYPDDADVTQRLSFERDKNGEELEERREQAEEEDDNEDVDDWD